MGLYGEAVLRDVRRQDADDGAALLHVLATHERGISVVLQRADLEYAICRIRPSAPSHHRRRTPSP